MARYNHSEEFITLYKKEVGCTTEEAKFQIKAVTNCLKKCLLMNNAVNIRQVGSFKLLARKNSLVRNPKTGVTQRLPLLYYVSFNAAQSLKAAVNEKIKTQIKYFRDN